MELAVSIHRESGLGSFAVSQLGRIWRKTVVYLWNGFNQSIGLLSQFDLPHRWARPGRMVGIYIQFAFVKGGKTQSLT